MNNNTSFETNIIVATSAQGPNIVIKAQQVFCETEEDFNEFQRLINYYIISRSCIVVESDITEQGIKVTKLSSSRLEPSLFGKGSVVLNWISNFITPINGRYYFSATRSNEYLSRRGLQNITS